MLSGLGLIMSQSCMQSWKVKREQWIRKGDLKTADKSSDILLTCILAKQRKEHRKERKKIIKLY